MLLLNIISNFKFTINELENLEQLLDLASSENNSSVIKDCENKIISLLNDIKKRLVKDEREKMLITTYSFFSVILVIVSLIY